MVQGLDLPVVLDQLGEASSFPITSSTQVRADTPDHRVAASAGAARGSGGAAMTSA